MQLTRAHPQGSGLLLIGRDRASVPFDGGTVLVVPQVVAPFQPDAAGAWSLPFDVPNAPSLCSVPLRLQAWIGNDPNAGGLGFAASAGLELRPGI